MRRFPIMFGTLALAMAMATTTAQAQEAGTLRQQMSRAEFSAAGLDKLSARELAALETWLQRHGATMVAAPPQAPAAPVPAAPAVSPAASSAPAVVESAELERIREQAREEGRQEIVQQNRGFFDFGSNEPIESTIDGDFIGFGKGTQYTLANGQLWEQTDATRLHGAHLTNAEVSIKPGALGVWYMRVKGFNTATKVRRIK